MIGCMYLKARILYHNQVHSRILRVFLLMVVDTSKQIN